MTFLAVTLLIVYFSCNINCEPRYPLPNFDDDGNIEWDITPRIVGGTLAAAGEFKGKISIQERAFYPLLVTHFCGGTLIHPSHVLTAAHCVTETKTGALRPIHFFVLVGDVLTLDVLNLRRQAKYATHIFVHPEYNIKTISNDIAIIRVNSPFRESTTFSPVVRVANTPIPGSSCSVAGWGALYHGGTITTQLQRINATIYDRTVCNGRDSYQGLVKTGMLCAGTMDGGIDTCQGDSGGGLICENYLAGIVSWGIECALPFLPGVYTDVAKYNGWIDEMIEWDILHENIPTPTTVIADITDSSSDSIRLSLNLIVASVSLMIIVQKPLTGKGDAVPLLLLPKELISVEVPLKAPRTHMPRSQ